MLTGFEFYPLCRQMMIEIVKKIFLKFPLVAAFLVCLNGCSGGPGNQDSREAMMDRDAARQKLMQRKAATAAQQQQEAEKQRAAEEKAAAEEARRQEEANRPHYDPQRLQQAAKVRQWQNVTIPDFNINCWLKSTWTDGKMNLRLAMVGDKTALRIFQGKWPYFRLIFTDGIGNNLHQAWLRSSDLHWADSLKNSGAPTLEFEASTEMPLNVYESCVAWNIKWELEMQ